MHDAWRSKKKFWKGVVFGYDNFFFDENGGSNVYFSIIKNPFPKIPRLNSGEKIESLILILIFFFF